jgi:putative chitinase
MMQLLRACGIPAQLVTLHGRHIAETCTEYDITGAARLSCFLGQIFHESGRLRYTREIWGPTAQQVAYGLRLAKRLGNTCFDDGQRYRGRGLVQYTGRANYRTLSAQLRKKFPDAPNFEANPEMLKQPRWAALSAGNYWAIRGLNKLADIGDYTGITRRINGGYNGLADRQSQRARVLAAIITRGI